MARASEQQINDVMDVISRKWKSCGKKLLRDKLAATRVCFDFGKMKKDNDPGAGNDGGQVINEDSHASQVAYTIKRLRETNEDKPTLFRHGTELARLNYIREEGSLSIQIMDQKIMRAEINRCADFYVRGNDETERGVSVPMDVVSDVFCEINLPLPYLSQVSTYPVFDAQGNLVAHDGYHPSAHLYLQLPAGLSLPRVSGQPSREDVAKALRILIFEVLGDFPFDGYTRRELLVACGIEEPAAGETKEEVPASLLSYLAFLIQPIVRPLIGRAPMPALLVTKPAAGSGASKLVELAMQIILGVTSTRPSMPDSEEERRKQYFSALRSGNPYIMHDNVTGAINSPVLAALLTSIVFTDRVLGRSEERSIPNQASVVLTGNNPTFSKELIRRLSLCRIDAGVSKPEDRTDFHHEDLEKWVSENRADTLWALCTLVSNWIALGRPAPSGAPLASYVSWYNVCGGILEAAGLKGFQSNRDQIEKVADADEDDPIQEFVTRWYEIATMPRSNFALKDQYAGGEYGLAALADSGDVNLAIKRKRVDEEVKYDPTAMGQFLATCTDRVFEMEDGTKLKLTSEKKTNRGKPWSLSIMDSDATA